MAGTRKLPQAVLGATRQGPASALQPGSQQRFVVCQKHPARAAASRQSRRSSKALQHQAPRSSCPTAPLTFSIFAMWRLLWQPNFILWTGDGTPHVPNKKLGEKAWMLCKDHSATAETLACYQLLTTNAKAATKRTAIKKINSIPA